MKHRQREILKTSHEPGACQVFPHITDPQTRKLPWTFASLDYGTGQGPRFWCAVRVSALRSCVASDHPDCGVDRRGDSLRSRRGDWAIG
jgi:hypothetical protein